jgi:protein phosphatase
MTDSIWLAIVVCLVFLLLLTWRRGTAAPIAKPVALAPTPPPLPRVQVVEPPPPVQVPEPALPSDDIPRIDIEESDEDIDPTRLGPSHAAEVAPAPTKRIVYDEEAAVDEPTGAGPLILVTAQAQTDVGLRRKRNEDSLLVLPKRGLYVVADGMGGYKGGEVASALAVQTIQQCFEARQFPGPPHDSIPQRASELARAVNAANAAIYKRAREDTNLHGMGTTVCAARFSPSKQRLYIGHVGDSRMYRLRGGVFEQMTSDHTMRDFGATGREADHLSRTVGVWPLVPIDIILGIPQPGDVYLLCSDGLTKMVKDDDVSNVLRSNKPPSEIVELLIDCANASGGKDNITVIVIRVERRRSFPSSRAS